MIRLNIPLSPWLYVNTCTGTMANVGRLPQVLLIGVSGVHCANKLNLVMKSRVVPDCSSIFWDNGEVDSVEEEWLPFLLGLSCHEAVHIHTAHRQFIISFRILKWNVIVNTIRSSWPVYIFVSIPRSLLYLKGIYDSLMLIREMSKVRKIPGEGCHCASRQCTKQHSNETPKVSLLHFMRTVMLVC